VIVVDSSVWIDYFNGVARAETDLLDRLAGVEPLALGDLNLLEVLHGFRSDADAARARDVLLGFTVLPMLGTEMALRCAENYRLLRGRGVTVRKTADVVIASYCIAHGHRLLFTDRDFLPFVRLLGLERA